MNRVLAAGGGLTVLGLVGYGAGIVQAYPGRALSVTVVMMGFSLLSLGWAGAWR